VRFFFVYFHGLCNYFCDIFTSLGDSTVINIDADVHATMASVPSTTGSVVIDIPDVIPLQQDVNAQQSADTLTIDAEKIEKVDPFGMQEVQGADANVAVIPKSTGAPSNAAPKSTAAPSIGQQAAKAHTLSAKEQVNITNNRTITGFLLHNFYLLIVLDTD